MKRNIMEEAVENAKRISTAAMENAEEQLTEAFSTNLKKVVSEGMKKNLKEMLDDEDEVIEDPLEEEEFEGEDEDEDEVEIGSDNDFSDDEEDSEIDLDVDSEEGFEDDLDDGDDDDVEIDIDVDAEDGDFGDEDEEELDLEMGDEDLYDDEEEEDDVFEVIELDEEDEIVGELVKENKRLKSEAKQYKKALTYLTNKIDEVNLFNARLAYSTKLMRQVTLTKEQKDRVIDRFDECESIREVKRTYNTLNEAWVAKKVRTKRAKVRKPVQSVSQIKEGVEEKQLNEGSNRWQELAGIVK